MLKPFRRFVVCVLALLPGILLAGERFDCFTKSNVQGGR